MTCSDTEADFRLQTEENKLNICKFGLVSVDRIEAFQKKYKVRLPESYVRFLNEKNGGVASGDASLIFVPGLNEHIQVDIFYGLDMKEDSLNIEYWMGRYVPELPEKSVIIGDDQLKGFLVIICEGENQGLYYWDDKFNFPQSDDEGSAYLISDDLQSIWKLFA